MRISTLQASASMIRNINHYSVSLNKLTEKMALQKKVLVPSDDPIAATRLVQLNREQSAINQYQSNITRLSGSLGQQEAHMDSISKQLLAIRDKVLLVSNGSLGQDDVSGYGSELDSMLESIVSTLNSKDEEGRYLFSGTASGTKPVEFDSVSGKFVYQGNTNTRDVTVANGINIDENINGGDLFFDGNNDLLNDLNELVGMMKDPNTDFNLPAYKDALGTMIDKVDLSMKSVTGTIGELGNRQNQIALLDEAHIDVKTSNEMVIKDLSELDYAESMIDLNSYLLAMQATQGTFVKISQLSLFDAIR